MSKQPTPAPTASAKGPCPTIIKTVGHPGTGSLPRAIAPPDHPHGVYISQLIHFARVSSHVDDFNTRNKVLTAKLPKQGYRYHKLLKAFSKFYRRNFDLVSKYNVGLKTLLLQGFSEPELYGGLVYKYRKIIVNMIFLIISRR